MVRIFICLRFLFSAAALLGQVEPQYQFEELKGIIYRNEYSVDTRVHTNGFAVAFNIGNIVTYRKTNYYHIEIGYLRDPREQKQTRNIGFAFNTTSSSFRYGKRNSAFILRGGVGRKRFLSDKAKRKGIAIGYSYEAGPAIALLKPYYLRLEYLVETENRRATEIREEKYSESNAEKFLNYNDIYGSAGWTRGFNELGFIPGAQAKAGLFFSLGAYDKYVKSVEVGLMADVFLRPLPIMVDTENVSNKPYFVNLYLNLQLGKRSN